MVIKFLISISLVCFMILPLNDEVMTWNDSKKLTWKDFRATPKQNTTAVAVTASGITFEYSVKESQLRGVVSISTKVSAQFYPNKSWYIKDRIDAHILAHEQLHFDITELHARKFRKQIAALNISNQIKNQLQQLHQDINIQLAAMQNKYDTESNNSMNKEEQAKWATYVKQQLLQLEAYASKN